MRRAIIFCGGDSAAPLSDVKQSAPTKRRHGQRTPIPWLDQRQGVDGMVVVTCANFFGSGVPGTITVMLSGLVLLAATVIGGPAMASFGMVT